MKPTDSATDLVSGDKQLTLDRIRARDADALHPLACCAHGAIDHVAWPRLTMEEAAVNQR
jgi:hypothetical protein